MKKSAFIILAAAIAFTACKKEVKKSCWQCSFSYEDIAAPPSTLEGYTQIDTTVCDMTKDESNNFRFWYEQRYKEKKGYEYMNGTSDCKEITW